MPLPWGLTLSVADNGNGTGAATVSGLTPGTTARVSSAAMSFQTGPAGAVTSGGTAVANGAGVATLTVSPGYGYWLFVAAEETAGVTTNTSRVVLAPLVRPVSAGGASVWERCVDAVVAVVQGLALPGLTADKVQKGWWPKVMRGMTPAPPCVLVSPFGPEEYVSQINDRDDVGYPVIVVLVDAIDRETTGNLTRDLLWRQSVMRAFRFQRLTGVSEIWWTDVFPDVVVNPDAFANNVLVSAMVFRFVSREPRGIGT